MVQDQATLSPVSTTTFGKQRLLARQRYPSFTVEIHLQFIEFG